MPLADRRGQITKECGLPVTADIRFMFALAEKGPFTAVTRPRMGISSKRPAITGVTLPLARATVSCGLMAFNALLMCREEKHLRILGKALDGAGKRKSNFLLGPGCT